MHVSNKLTLVSLSLSGEWEILSAPSDCNRIEVISSQSWWWASDKDGAYEVIQSGQSYILVNRTMGVGSRRSAFDIGENICWVKGSGDLYIKCER